MNIDLDLNIQNTIVAYKKFCDKQKEKPFICEPQGLEKFNYYSLVTTSTGTSSSGTSSTSTTTTV